MLVRLKDFAEINRITERTVQVHIKENWDVLRDHVDRRGKQGTWLDDFAQEFLIERIQLPSKDEVLVPTPREAALLIQIAEANRSLAEAERRAAINAEAAGKVLFLEARSEAQESQITDLTMKVGELGQKLSEADKRTQDVREASERALKASEEEWTRRLAEAQEQAQKQLTEAQNELAEAQVRHEEELRQEQNRFNSMSIWEFLKEKRKKER